jgi:glycosyltransferase involved in cell wall biosynthesis
MPTARRRHPELEAVRAKFGITGPFLLYPAQTWRHKNHLALLDAVALLRDRRAMNVPVVCTGYRNSFFPEIRRRRAELGLKDLVRFVGFVEPAELRALYALCRGLVFPSLFEGWGLPVTEAFSCGVPVACSTVTCLPELVGNAALLFDPRRLEEIAGSMEQLWLDERLRGVLIERGHRRAAALSWQRVAGEFRDLYRSVVPTER